MKLIRVNDRWLAQDGVSLTCSIFDAGRFTRKQANATLLTGGSHIMDECSPSVAALITPGELKALNDAAERDSKIAYLEAMIQQMKDGCNGGCALDECVCEKDQRVVDLKEEVDDLRRQIRILHAESSEADVRYAAIEVEKDHYRSALSHQLKKTGELRTALERNSGHQDIQRVFVEDNFKFRTALQRIIKLDTREAQVRSPYHTGNCYTVEEFPGPCARIAMEALGVEEVKRG